VGLREKGFEALVYFRASARIYFLVAAATRNRSLRLQMVGAAYSTANGDYADQLAQAD
jgi:hypothetical protein